MIADHDKSIVISDLSNFGPKPALSTQARLGCWRLVDYELEGGLEGAMLFAAPDDQAPPITLALEVEGLHAIHLAFNYTRSAFFDQLNHVPFSLYGTLWASLSSDPGFSRFAAETRWRHDEIYPDRCGGESQLWHSVHEVFWKVADLTGQSLTIRPPEPPFDTSELCNVANLTYIRLVPIEGERAEWFARLKPSTKTRRCAVQLCSGHLSGHTAGSDTYHPTNEQWIRNDLTPFLDNDVGIVCFEAIRGNLCTYRTKIGDVGTEDNHWPDQWVDPLATAVKIAHEHGVKLFAGMRMIGASLPVVRNPIQWARYYWKHPEWVKRDPEGRSCSNLSIAFEPVRSYWLSLLGETLELGCDGVHLLFDRCFPFVLYEQPSIDRFQDRYGEDPRTVPPDDERWIAHQCDMVSQFLREVRSLVDQKPDRFVAVHFRAGEYETWRAVEPRHYGCDVETWIREGLVDYLMPTPCASSALADSLSRWRKLAGSKIKIYPDLFPRSMPGEAYADLAACYYEAGADGFVMRDCERRHPRSSEWAVARHLGHREMLGELGQEWTENYWRRFELKVLNGMAVKHSFNDG